MTRDEIDDIVRVEGLRRPVFLDEAIPLRENAVVLDPRDSGWRVYVTQERSAVAEGTVRDFADESEALAYALTKLRELHSAFRARALLEDLPVDVWQSGFGGSQILVGKDGTILFGNSSLDLEAMLNAWRSGTRPPIEELEPPN